MTWARAGAGKTWRKTRTHNRWLPFCSDGSLLVPYLLFLRIVREVMVVLGYASVVEDELTLEEKADGERIGRLSGDESALVFLGAK